MISGLNEAAAVTPDLLRLRTVMVNAYYLGTGDDWYLIDAGMPGSARAIVDAAKENLGTASPPRAILMTHGHFDHVGAFPEILETWDVPVYAHPLEMPFLTGEQDYPPPDPTVGKGALALMSFLYPSKAIDLGTHVRPFPEDGTLPGLPEWRWIPTPGHSAGHTSFFRGRDRLLIAGDAFVTTQQESIYNVITQAQRVSGPPAYFTPDWPAAKHSVETLAALDPAIAATGHGVPMSGDELRQGLRDLVLHFDSIAVPDHGRYVEAEEGESARSV
jgi:glyoxylase-like metal-dependent hydrolase (beta-lactamase superfamily II)